MSSLHVESVGAEALVEDLGRPGYAHLGVTPSGAADRRALRLANRLLGNPEGAAAVEILLGGLALRASGHVVACLTGAPAPLWVDGSPVPGYVPFDVPDGRVLAVGTPPTGLRSYLAVRGGLAAPLLFGSASTDPTQGLGPAPLAPGMRLEVGRAATDAVTGVDELGPCGPPLTDVVLRVVLGPRQDWLSDNGVRAVTSTAWTVASDSDRVAVRLSGPPLERAVDRELPSEPVVRGGVQVPPSGQPLVFLADHPTTGGYPVVAAVLDEDTDALAQMRPGERVRFRAVLRPW